MATLTGLEPATSAVTGRRANQLRYRAMFPKLLLLPQTKTPGEPRACVAPTGVDPVTFRFSVERSTN